LCVLYQTNGAVKALDIKDAVGAGQQLIFSNSYHLMLQPGGDIIEAAGGLHKFMRYDGPLITDSGGFQIFSLANQGGVHGDVGEIARSKDDAEPLPRVPGGELKRAVARKKTDSGEGVVSVTEEGVVFRSYRDGTYVTLTPESTVQAQKQYGSDIIIPLDEVFEGELNQT
jgi:queuine tRNA-ribosyltransferase